MKSINEHLADLSRRDPVMTFDEVRALVTSTPHRTPRRFTLTARRITMTVSALLLAALGIATLVNTGEQQQEMVEGSKSRVSTTSSKKADPSIADASETTHEQTEARVNASSMNDAEPVSLQSQEPASSIEPNEILPAEKAPQSNARDRDEEPRDDSFDSRVDVSGVRTIELSYEELTQLGIRADTAGVWVSSMSTTIPLQFSMYGTIAYTQPELVENLGLPRGPASATLVTDDRGQYRAYTYDDEQVGPALEKMYASSPRDEQGRIDITSEMAQRGIAALTNTMIPILVRTGREFTEADAGRWRPDCIVWFMPTEKLIAALPARVRDRITIELSEVERRATDQAVEIAPLTGEPPLLDALRATSGAIIATSVAPNPARGSSMLKYELREDRMVTVALHSIAGDPLRTAMNATHKNAGKHSIAIPLDGLQQGIYLAVVRTDRGEHAVQRLIVVQ
ncbi:MAG: T9SS type A sorting domain-containing protein [bacterium]|nr:T9SS type A sorting domain-containing protein [Candidatus Kapabacteria bacterium]